jgi:hypothetical protein
MVGEGLEARPVHLDGAGVGPLEPAHEVEEGGLAGAGRAEQGAELSLGERHVDALEHLDARASFPIALAEVPNDGEIVHVLALV